MFSILRRYVGAISVSSSSSSSIIPNNKFPRFVSYYYNYSSPYALSPKLFPTPKSDPKSLSFPHDFCNTSTEAVSSFETMLYTGNATIPFYNYVFSALAKRDAFTTVISLVKQLEESSSQPHFQFNRHLKLPDARTWAILVQCHSGLGNMSSAISLFNHIIHTGHYPTTQTLNHLLQGFCLRREIDKAMLFYNDIILKNGYILNHDSYLILINGFCDIGETQLAINMLRQALLLGKEPQNQNGFQADTLQCCYNSIIFRLSKDRLVNQAYDLYSQMIHVNNIEPSSITYKNLIYGYCILGQFKQALRLIKELETSTNLLCPSPHTLVTEQEVKSAKSAAALMIKDGVKPNVASFQSVMGRLYKGGSTSLVMNKITEMVEMLLRAKHYHRLTTINNYD